MALNEKKILSYFKLKRILIPITIGLLMASYLLFKEFNIKAFDTVIWNWESYLWLIAALFLMGVRDFSYMYRIRCLTENQITWRNSFDVIMLWEFASAVTPSVIGGSAIAFYIVNKEGIKLGKTTAIVMVTALMDELFYIITVPVLILLVGPTDLFNIKGEFTIFNTNFGIEVVFILGYLFILFLTLIITYGIFGNPRGFKALLLKIFKIPFLRKWRTGAAETGDDIITTSAEFKAKSLKFWLKPFIATIFSWTARFWVVNCLIMAFTNVENHFLVYARQLVMWVILLISPTPGSSGVAEWAFSSFLREFINPGLSSTLALMWRLISYYPYLFIGLIILPAWLRRVYKVKQKLAETKNCNPK